MGGFALGLRDGLSVKIAEMIYNGFWFAPEFRALQGMIEGIMHPVNGDEVLRQIGRLLGAGVRTSDFVGRYGGEEFCVVLPETTASSSGNMRSLAAAGVSSSISADSIPSFPAAVASLSSRPLRSRLPVPAL